MEMFLLLAVLTTLALAHLETCDIYCLLTGEGATPSADPTPIHEKY